MESSLTLTEKHDFIRAIKCISKTPSLLNDNLTIYDDIAVLHGGSGSWCHRSACFLPWHRNILAVIETILKDRCQYRGSMPYRDWSLDWMNLANSSIWDHATGFGGDGDMDGPETVGEGRCVMDGPFTDLRPVIYNHTRTVHCLSRGFRDGSVRGRLSGKKFSPENVGSMLRLGNYTGFLRRVERDLHSTLHTSINGDFKAMTAANDPLFFLHHANLDRLWWRWQVTFDIIPGLLTAVPYGIMADAYGRELVLGLSVLGGAMASSFTILVCSLPSVFSPRMIWLGSAFGFVGGGTPVFNAVTFAIISSVVSERQRWVVFLYIAATVLGSQLVASPSMYFLINVDTWLPIYCGLVCLWLATAVAFLVPRMLATSPVPEHVKTEQVHGIQTQTARDQLVGIAKAAVWFARGNGLVTALLLTFLVTSLGRLAQEIILQNITKRYGWSWSEAGLVLSLHALFTLTLLTVILPVASQTLALKTALATQSRTLWLARVSVSMSTLGAFTIGLSETVGLMAVGLALFALGNGCPPSPPELARVNC